MYSLHLPAFPHTHTTKEYLTCAYTQKIVKFAKMMTGRGHRVFIYGGEKNEAICTEHVPLFTEQERHNWFGDGELGYFPDFSWDASHPGWLALNTRAAAEIAKRAEPRDFLCLATSTQSPIAAMLPHLMAVESGVGYEGITANLHCAFESYAWMHHVYGLRGIKDGRNFDAVIPNYFDPDDFPHLNKGDGEYLLYVGRLIPRKGIEIAIETAKATGLKLKVAGANDVFQLPPEVDYVGPVGLEERAWLMAGAKALLVPTLYLEPFGGVAVEAMMCGTPVISSDWGAFPETVKPGAGFRCRTLKEWVNAVALVEKLDPTFIRNYAISSYGLGEIAGRFEQWFDRLSTLYTKGWYQLE